MPSDARTLRHLNEDYDDDDNGVCDDNDDDNDDDDDNSNDDDDDDDGGGDDDDDDDDETGPFGFYFKLLLKYVFLNVNTVHGNK